MGFNFPVPHGLFYLSIKICCLCYTNSINSRKVRKENIHASEVL